MSKAELARSARRSNFVPLVGLWQQTPMSFRIGAIVLLIHLIIAVTGPFWAPYGQAQMNLSLRGTPERLADRQRLLRSLDTVRRDLDVRGEMIAMDESETLVRHLLTLTFGPKWQKDVARISRGF